ncbi:hypothetical protein [Streptomyces sp. NPDC058632]
MPHEDGAGPVPEGGRASVLLDGGARTGVLVQVAEMAVGDDLAVRVVRLP